MTSLLEDCAPLRRSSLGGSSAGEGQIETLAVRRAEACWTDENASCRQLVPS